MQSSAQRRFSNTTLLPAAIFLLGLVLRLGLIDAHGFWTDEVSSIEIARKGLPFIFNSHFGWPGNQTSWHYMLIWLLIQPLDPAVSPVLVRLPSALAGAFLALVVYGLGRELFSRTAGLVAALMVALSPILLDHSHDLRPYSLFAFLTATSVLCLVMADRTWRVGWWLGFVVAMVANVLNSYLAVTLVLPALAPYLAWTLWRSWAGRREEGRERNFLSLLLSLGVVGLAAGLMLLQYIRLPATPVDWSKFSIASLANMPVNVFASFTDVGLGGQAASLVSFCLLLMAIFGAYAAVRSGHGRGAFICASLCLIPSFVLAVLVTSNLIFPRYVLFIGPFYFLLIGNAVGAALQVRPAPAGSGPIHKLARAGAVVLAAFVVVFCFLGGLNYVNPAMHETLTYKPDFRGVAAYLSERAGPQDTIILADYPAHGYSVTDFYWHDKPPAPLYDARDPRLFRQQMQGNVYWVVSLLDPQLMSKLAAPDQGWLEVGKFERVLVLKESASGRTAMDLVAKLADRMDALDPGFVPTRILRAGVLQAHGDAAGAARLYQDAVTGFWTGDIYLRTAEGFEAAGLDAISWREGIISKDMEPYRPQVHQWLAQQLLREGYAEESAVEGKIADILQYDAGAVRSNDARMVSISQP
jgi:4-amino-4-deoxy-L-arabinose transferase-like glycosyltransferase